MARRRRDGEVESSKSYPVRPSFVQPLSLLRSQGLPSLGATATTAASGGNREELLGQRPAGCKRQRSRRWEPQPGQWQCEALTERFCPLSCNQTVAFFTLFSKIKGKLKNVLLKKWRICVTLHPSCNGIFGDSGVFPPVFFGSEGRRQSDYHAFFLLFCPFWLFSGHLALWQGGKYGKIV